MVFVLSKQKKPLNMCTEAKARVLLKKGYALVHKVYPFTIRLKTDIAIYQATKGYQFKIDPGSLKTGVAIVDNDQNVTLLAELEHRGKRVVDLLKTRRDARRNRRQRETRYRRCKFINRYLKKGSKYKVATDRHKGWLPPSIQSIEQNTVNLVKKYRKLCNITSVSIESVKFDMQLLNNPNISGVQYQQGTLWGYEVKEYLLEKHGHICQYCGGESKDTVLQVEHMVSKTNGGSDSIKNLNLACRSCNSEKGGHNLDQWLVELKKAKKTPLNEVRIGRIEKIFKGEIFISKRYAAWVNSYRWELVNDLNKLNAKVELSSGGRTKFNRLNHRLPKEHYYDALCVGDIPEKFHFKTDQVLLIKAMGRGSRFRGRTNNCGIIIKQLPRQKNFFEFQTGDMVKAIVSKGKKVGSYIGRVAVRFSGYFNIQTKNGVVQGIKHSDCNIIQRGNGYNYSSKKRSVAV